MRDILLISLTFLVTILTVSFLDNDLENYLLDNSKNEYLMVYSCTTENSEIIGNNYVKLKNKFNTDMLKELKENTYRITKCEDNFILLNMIK